MEIGFEFVAAQSKKRAVEDEPAQETMRGARKIMSNPSTDQKKVRRQMSKKAAYEPNKVIHDHEDNTDMHTNVGAHQLQEGDTLVGLNGSQISNVKHHGPYEAPNDERTSIPQTTFNYDHPSDPLWQGKDYQSPTYAEHGFTVKRPCDGSCGKTAEGSRSTTAALDDTKDCRLCGGELDGQQGKVKCTKCGTEHSLQTKSALDDSKDCRLCGGTLSGTSGSVNCTKCGTEHNLQAKSSFSYRGVIASRAQQVLNTTEAI